MAYEAWAPPTEPPKASLTISDILNVYDRLKKYDNPTPKIAGCLDKLEDHIKTFVDSLQSGQTK